MPIKKHKLLKKTKQKTKTRKTAVRGKTHIKRAHARRRTHGAYPQKRIFKKSETNPIIAPRQEHNWEAYQTFNPAALLEDGNVHILYRALGHDGVSRLGYAKSDDGITITERSNEPVYTAPATRHDHLTSPIAYDSGGGWGGCEDPRLVRIDDRVYLTFVAFDGWGSVQMALSWIELNDFLNKKWKWKKPVLISPPGEVHKNWVLFPEKIKGKYAILHSISPHILIDYFDSLDEFDTHDERTYYIKSHYTQNSAQKRWDSWVRGAGPPPIKTKYGWLLLYHAMDAQDPNRYKLGAMILDEKNPTKILSRSQHPILEPDEQYENQGHKAGVIYSCGAVVNNERLFIYYGGADMVTCVATADLEKFLQALIHDKPPRLTHATSRRKP
ncbi:MAG: hypothetical protein Q8R40_00385 [bacterium]|nr:hypothetical protein [bacterium]